MLEIIFLQQNDESLYNPPAKFHITQIKNGCYALSSIGDHFRLHDALSNWQKVHSTIHNPDAKYQELLETSKNILKANIANSIFFTDQSTLDVSSFGLDPFKSKIEKMLAFDDKLDSMGGQQMILQDKDFNRNKMMEHFEDNRLFIGCGSGEVYEYSINEKRTVYDFGKKFNCFVSSMATTFDNKYLFVCDYDGEFREFDISTHNQVNEFGVENAGYCVVTYDNKFLITTPTRKNAKLTKQSIQTKQRLHTWDSNVNEDVMSQNCSQDSKLQFIGYDSGWLGIYDIKKDKTLENIQVLSNDIWSVAFTLDYQSAFISDRSGKIKMIKWKPNYTTENYFDFTQNSIQVGNGYTFQICLTRDDKSLLVGSKGLVSILDTETRNVTKEFKMSHFVTGIKMMYGGIHVLIAETNDDLTVINLETLKMYPIHKNATNGKGLYKIALTMTRWINN